jgi:hypothetical protein
MRFAFLVAILSIGPIAGSAYGTSAVAAPASTLPPYAAQPSPSPTASASPPGNVPPLYVHGQVLTISGGYFIFTSGDSMRVASGLIVPPGVTTGSYVRVTVDQLARVVTAIELEPHANLPAEIDAANIPRQYVVVSPKSAPLPAPTGQSAAAGNGLVTVTIVVHVPANTPTSDDVYLATDRSSYSPAEVRMDRVDGSTFSISVAVAQGTALKYQFTRGSYATVERDRTGGIVNPHVVLAEPNAKTNDTVTRWADIS